MSKRKTPPPPDELKKALLNGHAGDRATQGNAMAYLIGAMQTLQERVLELPTRKEVLDIVEESLTVHATTCSSSSRGKGEGSFFKLGKGGLEAKGAVGVVVGGGCGALLVFGLIKVAPFIASWLDASK